MLSSTNLLSGVEVDDTFSKTAIIDTDNSNAAEFTSLLATSLDNTLFLFIGTSNGDVLQVSMCVVSLVPRPIVSEITLG